MIWLAWRRQRTQVLVSLGLITLIAALFLVIGGFEPHSSNDIINTLDTIVSPQFLVALPVLLGAFAGGPMFARESSQGTGTFVLTQSASRLRWWACRVLIATVPVTVALVILSRVYYWTDNGPHPEIQLFTPDFEVSGTLLAAYYLLATAIGALSGLFVRRSTAAIAITLAGYLAIAFVIGNFARPHLLPPAHDENAIVVTDETISFHGGGLITGYIYKDAEGNPMPEAQTCGTVVPDGDCLYDHRVSSATAEYQPRSRYWSLQWIETAIVVALAGGVFAAGAWRLRRWHG
ncbi:MAG: ABC transporter permease [Stackebrandtia sp.]